LNRVRRDRSEAMPRPRPNGSVITGGGAIRKDGRLNTQGTGLPEMM